MLGLCGYIAEYNGKKIEVWAENSYQAQLKAAKEFKARKSWQVSVYLCVRANGTTCENTTI